MRALSIVLFSSALYTLALPSTPGECKPLSSLSFTYPLSTAKGLSAHIIFNNLTEPRGIRIDGQNNLLVIERLKGMVSLTKRNDSTCVGWEKRVVISQADLEHGIEIGPIPGKKDKQYLYATSQETLYRWEYDPKNAVIVGNSTILVYNMTNPGNFNDTNPNHVTRTLLLQPDANQQSEYIIVSRGSAGNSDDGAADVNTGRAQIRRFPLTKKHIPAQGYSWNEGTILAWGVRNSVGIALSKDKKDLWGIENGSDNVLWRGVDVHNDNPAEELNRISLHEPERIPNERKFYGYPYCFTTWNSSSVPRNWSQPVFDLPTGAQFSILPLGSQPDDAWCQNPKNSKPSRLLFQAHSAPLDFVFYDTSKYGSRNNDVGLTRNWDGDAFSAFHGSFNSNPPTGYSVVRIPWANDAPRASANSTKGYEQILYAPDKTKCPSQCIRPVALAFGKQGELYATSDETGEVFVIENRRH
ncbi:pyrroloquinoline quinone binding [Rhizoctonia solani]|uniref:Pyrroloquinoline quinone binding n=2 Tax=Rhizoctonia solani TaxID=456999 RepID=A0A8H7LEL3_9AGAM|nr:pyrroloquinoline quinone binding [Rhizoctonia solani]